MLSQVAEHELGLRRTALGHGQPRLPGGSEVADTVGGQPLFVRGAALHAVSVHDLQRDEENDRDAQGGEQQAAQGTPA